MDKRSISQPVPNGRGTPVASRSTATAQTKCPYCFSTKVQIVDSYEMRDVMVIRCLNCGRQSEVDTENDKTIVGTIVPAPVQDGP